AFLREDCVRPFAAAADREGRSAVAADRRAAKVLEDVLGAAHVVTKFFRRLAIYPQMAEAMARQLVPFRQHAPNQLRMPLCHPSQDKEGRLDPALGQNLEQALGVAFYSARQTFPVAPVDRQGEGFDLKIILDVDR